MTTTVRRSQTGLGDTSKSARASRWGSVEDPLLRLEGEPARCWSEVSAATARGDLDEARAELARLEKLLGGCADRELKLRIECARLALTPSHRHDAAQLQRRFTELREVLASAEALPTQLLAAYELAHAFEQLNEWKKAAFYGRMALGISEALDDSSWMATVHNLLGNVCTGDSWFAEAEGHYRAALRLGLDSRFWEAQTHDNLSYVLAALGELPEARHHLARALVGLRHVGGRARLSVELDAAFIHAKCDQPERALHHALKAHDLCAKSGTEADVQNCLLIVSECAKRTGEIFLARRSLSELATRRGQPSMANALLGLDLLNTVNLRG